MWRQNVSGFYALEATRHCFHLQCPCALVSSAICRKWRFVSCVVCVFAGVYVCIDTVTTSSWPGEVCQASVLVYCLKKDLGSK